MPAKRSKKSASSTSKNTSVKAAKASNPKQKKRASVGGKPEILSSKTVYEAPVFHITSEEIVEPSGVKVRRDIVRHPGSVVIMPLDETGREPRILLGLQFRYAAMQELWEFPAGRIDEGEDVLFAAKRELEEETGYSAREWMRALFFYSSPGFLDEKMHLWLARDLVKGEARPEEDEYITHKFFTVEQAKELINSGKIIDGKTIAGILWIANKYTKPKK